MTNPSFLKAPLAIVGMACRLPGADNLDEYLDLLRSGRSGISELPEDRLKREFYYSPDKGVQGKSYSKLGGLIADRPIDTQVCPISDELRKNADVAHLVLCEVAAQACRHAGYDPLHLPHRNTGVFVGHSGGSNNPGSMTYATLAAEMADYLNQSEAYQQLPAEMRGPVIQETVAQVRREQPHRNAAGGPDVEPSAAASLIQRAFGLTGPYMVLDAACASSLTALALGAQAVQQGRVDMALVAGASYNKTDNLILFSHARSCSATGSRPFDAGADGLISSEGYVVLVIKTLEKALADKDTVHAVIRGIGLSSDGRGRSLWAPRKEGQIEAVRRAYGPDVDSAKVQYIEAHATSTQVGDATEVEALSEFFGKALPKGQRIPIGSVKANIGHTLETAGIASLLKTVLAMRAGVIPPAINLKDPNPAIDWPNIPFFVPKTEQVWAPPADGSPRRAAVNAFGIGGLNVHVVVDEYRPAKLSLPAVAKAPAPPQESIAIVGMGTLFPGALTAQAFWDLLVSGRDPKCDAPADRVRGDLNFSREIGPWKTPNLRGGYITDFVYDWRKHKIPPKQLEAANPLQFMLLDAADQALRDAGYDKKAFDRLRTSVVVGTFFGGDFTESLQMGLRLPEFEKTLRQVLANHGVTGPRAEQIREQLHKLILKARPAMLDETGSFTASTLASRVSKTLDLMGGAIALDAGETSGSAALAVAVDMLLTGASNLVLCAAAQRSMGLTQLEDMSLKGHLSAGEPSPALDASARGCVPGEGVGMVVLKRLSDAQRDGDRIRAVIRGIAASSSPYDPGQGLRLAVERALTSAAIRPEEVSIVELGGRGIPALDAGEAKALSDAYAGPRKSPLLLGSVVAQIGYTFAAHGMASLAKATLSLEHGELPATFGYTGASPALTSQSNLRTMPKQAAIPPSSQPGHFIAGIDDLSPKGLSYHILLERGVPAPRVAKPVLAAPASQPIQSSQPVKKAAAVAPITVARSKIYRLGAASRAELARKLTKAAAGDLSQLHAGDSPFAGDERARLAIVAEDSSALSKKLQLAAQQFDKTEARPVLEEQGIFQGETGSKRPRVAFLFAGQSSQYPGMLRELVDQSFAAASAMHEVDAAMARFGYPTFADLAWRDESALGKDVWLTQVSLLLADTILARTLASRGIKPDLVAGQSFGEFPALVASGAWTLEQAIRVTRARCEAVDASQLAEGTMLSTTATPETARGLAVGLDAWVTNHNAPDQTVMGGTQAAMVEVARRLGAAGYDARPLAVPRPFHTPLMADTQPAMRRALEAECILPPSTPVLSSVTNRYVADPDDIRQNLVAQMVEPVRWVDLIERLADDGVNVFVEIGPSQVLTRLHRRILSHPEAVIVASDNPKRRGEEQLLRVAAVLECAGALEPAARAAPVQTVPTLVTAASPSAPVIRPVEHFDATRVRKAKLRESGSGAKPSVAVAAPTPMVAKPAIQPVERYDATNGRRQKLRESTAPAAKGVSTAPQPAASLPKNPAPIAPVAQVAAPPALELESFLVNFVVEQTGYPADIVELDADLEADLGIDSIKKAQLFGELREYFELPTAVGQLSLDDFSTLRHVMNFLQQSPTKAQPVATAALPRKETLPLVAAPALVVSQTSDGMDLQAFLINFVVEQTGYPAEIVELDADLEADLGIDSIKKAQLFGELREYFDMPVASGQLSLDEFPTLRHVMNFLQALPGKGDWLEPTPTVVAAPAAVSAPAFVAPQSATPASSTHDLEAFLVNFVVEQTGYPADIVELDADLEADLGIDSIKKAQLFGELREVFDLPMAAGSLSLDDFPTLRHVMAFLGGASRPATASSVAATPSVATPAAPAATKTSTNDLEAFLVNFVVEQTGYPADIVELDAELEADLGIDSIKKAQLFGELREVFDLPMAAGSLSLDDFPTLRHVRDFLGGLNAKSTPDGAPAADAPAPVSVASVPSATAVSATELEAFLVNFVVEQTGYPADIVELDADLEADLGIDSIKKAQLFGELREVFDLQSANGQLSLDDFPTLRHVLDFLVQSTSSPAAHSAEQAVAASSPASAGPFDRAAEGPLADMLLRLAGTPYEMGLAHGKALSAEIKTILKRIADLPVSKLAALQSSTELANPERFFGEAELEELRGLADGVGVHLGNIIAHNLSLYPDYVGGCTQFAVTARENSDLGMIHAVNEDSPLSLSLADCLARVVQVRQPQGRIAHLTFSMAGQLTGLNGINAAGLGVTSTLLLDRARREPETQGQVHSVLVKAILEQANDIESAVEIVRQAQRLGAWSMCISHAATDRLCYLEYDGEWLDVQHDRPVVLSTNHSLLGHSPGEIPAHSRHRLAQLEKLLAGDARGQVTVPIAQAALRDRHDLERGRQTAHPTMNTIRRVDNHVSVVMRPASGEIWVTLGPLAKNKADNFFRLSLKELSVDAELTASPMPAASSHAIQLLPAANPTPPAGLASRIVLGMVPMALPAGTGSPRLTGGAVILGDNPLSLALRDELTKLGVAVHQLPESDDPEVTLAALDRAWKSGVAPNLFISTPHDADARTQFNFKAWRGRRMRGMLLPYLVCQKWMNLVAEAGLGNQAALVVATSLGGDLGLSGNVFSAEGGGLAGILKCISIENLISGPKEMKVKAIDSPIDEPTVPLARAILAELAGGLHDIEVGIVAGQRYAIRGVPQPVPPPVPNAIRQGAVWVLTGGARGITAYVARELGKRYGLRLHLLGKSPAPTVDPAWRDLTGEALKQVKQSIMQQAKSAGKNPVKEWKLVEKAIEIDKTLADLRSYGVQATYHHCDVANHDALAAALDHIRKTDGPIEGVLHGAGFADDMRFSKKRREQVDEMMAVKLDGAVSLMELTQHDPLRHFIGFTSVSGRFGSNGGTDYSMTNETLSKQLNLLRRQRPEVKAISFHWHLWGEVGMGMSTAIKMGMELIGLDFMPAPEGCRHFMDELAAGVPVSEVLITDLNYYHCYFPKNPLDPTPVAFTVEKLKFFEKLGGPASGAVAAKPSPVATYPLLSGKVEATGEQLTAEVPFDPRVDSFLVQHKVHGKPILPVVIGLEALLEAALRLEPGRHVAEISNVRVVSGLKFHSDVPQTAQVKAQKAGEATDCELTADFRARDGRLVDANRPYLKGRVTLSDSPVSLPSKRPPVPTGAWQPIVYPESGQVFHGPALRRLRDFQVDAQSVWGRMSAPDFAELAGPRIQAAGWVVPSALLDACLFSVGVHTWFSVERIESLPFSFGRVRFGRAVKPGEECLCHVWFKSRDGKFVTYDFTLYGADGTAILGVEAYQIVLLLPN